MKSYDQLLIDNEVHFVEEITSNISLKLKKLYIYFYQAIVMKKRFAWIAVMAISVLISCKKDDVSERVQNQNPIIVDSSYIPVISELRYAQFGLFGFGFGDSGYYRFSADTTGNQFKVNITNTFFYVGSVTPDSVRYVYRYDTLYNLVSIEKSYLSQSEPPSALKFYYNYKDLIKIEETSNNTLLGEYHISRTSVNGNTKVSMEPYIVNISSVTDTISQSLFYEPLGQLVESFWRIGRNGITYKQSLTSDFEYQYTDGDLTTYIGSEVFDSLPPSQPGKDSLRITIAYTRHAAENPVLFEMIQKLYGKELYDFISLFDLFFESETIGSFELLKLPGQRKRSYDAYEYSALVYHNNNLPTLETTSATSENELDAENRLFRSKVNAEFTPDYFTWQVVYR